MMRLRSLSIEIRGVHKGPRRYLVPKLISSRALWVALAFLLSFSHLETVALCLYCSINFSKLSIVQPKPLLKVFANRMTNFAF
jgi:hypothetical protein